MKKLFVLLFFTFTFHFLPFSCGAQNKNVVDSLKADIKVSRVDSTTMMDFWMLSNYYIDKNSDSVLFYDNQIYEVALKTKNDQYISGALYHMGDFYANNVNFQKGLELYFEALKVWERMHDTNNMSYAWERIGSIYNDLEETDLAIYYEKKSYIVNRKFVINKPAWVVEIDNRIGYEYTLLQMPDSALPYFEEAYNLKSKEHKGYDTGEYALTLWGLGKVNYQQGNLSIAMPYYKKSIEYAKNRTSDGYYTGGLAFAGMGELFKAMGANDSSIIYYRKALEIELEPKHKLTIYRNLAELYQNTDKDLAFTYLMKEVKLRDSLYTANNKREVKNMTLNEQDRQRDIATKLIQEKEQRKENIQYALIALGLVVSIILFLLLSRSIIANEWLIKLLGVMSLLIVFEFLNLVLHPFLQRITNNTPLLMLLALVAIAAILVPLHHRLEKWATHRLVEKNKQIRLAAAKKTIEKLENNKTN